MNGALGVVRGFVFPVGFDPTSQESRARTPLCVMVEFDEINLGIEEVLVDREGKGQLEQVRRRFCKEVGRENWVLIFSCGCGLGCARQREAQAVSSGSGLGSDALEGSGDELAESAHRSW